MKVHEDCFVRGSSPCFAAESNSRKLGGKSGNLSGTNNDYINQTAAIKIERGAFAFWTIVIILLILTVGNLLLTLTIIGVLNLNKGIYGMELIPEEDVIRFYDKTDLDRIYLKNVGEFNSFDQESMIITGDNNAVNIRMHHRNGQSHNRMIVDKSGVQFRGIGTFELKDKSGNTENILSTHRPHYKMPKGADNLIAKTNSASRIVSPINKSLNISALDHRIYIKGSEGLRINAANAYFKAENNVIINSTHGGVYLQGSAIFLNVDKIPIVNTEMGLRTGSVQYKLCICMPHGIVFRITIPRIHNGPKVSCVHFNSKHDPCTVN